MPTTLLVPDANSRLRNPQWRAQMLRPLPGSWRREIERRIERMDAEHGDWRHGNEYLIKVHGWCQEAVFPLHTTLSELRDSARARANECFLVTKTAHDKDAVMTILQEVCERWGVAMPRAKSDAGRIARLGDERWWSRHLRRNHAMALETAAIRLGLVWRRGECYVSNESLLRVEQQSARNRKTLESTVLANEDGECFTLQELADKSISNKAIRRGELMTRMRGLDEESQTLGHKGLFTVITAPSRFHAMHFRGEPHAKYEGATPRDTMAYLNAQWRKANECLRRLGVEFYGMRTVEPHHDGTPHWNVLVFFAKLEHVAVWKQVMRRYFLENDSPDEPGAVRRRVKFKAIDPAKGGATAYIAKYIAKNLDGEGLEADRYGIDIKESVRRVAAWVRVWGIHQFDAIGGAPVGLWRELRRIEAAALADAPEELCQAHAAAQKVKGEDGQPDKRADYAAFLRAYGGPTVKRRNARMWVHKEDREDVNRYGEPVGARVAGVGARGFGTVDKGGIVGRIRTLMTSVVKSVRRKWEVLKGKAARPSPPWTRVNNCTRPDRPSPLESSTSERFHPFWAPPDWPGGREPCFG